MSLHPLPARSAEASNSDPVVVPIKFQRGHLMVPATAKATNTLSFLLDTGYGISTIHPDWIEPLGLKRAGSQPIIGIAGTANGGSYTGAMFDIGGATYKPRRIASLPSDAETPRRRRDGVLGAGFFRRFVVEIDSKANTMTLRDPKTYTYSGTGEIIPLEFSRDTPIMEAAILVPGREPVRAKFEIDTGCDDCLCLGKDFVDTHRLLEHSQSVRDGARVGVGGDASIVHGTVPQLKLGALTLNTVSANFFTEGSPADEGMAGHIGLAALRHYKVIFDYARERMILETYP